MYKERFAGAFFGIITSMEIIIIVIAILQIFSVSLGVGSSTLAVLNFFVAIADGKISDEERNMMGVVYIVLRISMLAILFTSNTCSVSYCCFGNLIHHSVQVRIVDYNYYTFCKCVSYDQTYYAKHFRSGNTGRKLVHTRNYNGFIFS